jgi:hypothetical protein
LGITPRDNIGIDEPVRSTPGESIEDRRNRHVRHPAKRSVGVGRDVRGEDRALAPEQPRPDGWLWIEHVDAGCAEPSSVKRRPHRRLVDQLASRRVDEHSARSHLQQEFVIH